MASFCGGSVGVLSALLVVEVNNVKRQQRNRCAAWGRAWTWLRQDGQAACCKPKHVLAQWAWVATRRSAHPACLLGMLCCCRCHYCSGSGYLSCGSCTGTGKEDGASCACCAGTGKVMCVSCLCTGKQLATEHDPRIDPFND